MKAKATQLKGSIRHYCNRCSARLPAERLFVVWGKIVCDVCLRPTERDQERV